MTRLVAYEHDAFWTAVRADPSYPKSLEPIVSGGLGEVLVSDQEALRTMAWARSRREWDERSAPLEAAPLARART